MILTTRRLLLSPAQSRSSLFTTTHSKDDKIRGTPKSRTWAQRPCRARTFPQLCNAGKHGSCREAPSKDPWQEAGTEDLLREP
jgi:hypothetical protein